MQVFLDEPPIHAAARKADVDALRRELERGVPPDQRDGDGWTALYLLCRGSGKADDRLVCFNMLVEAGADVNATTSGEMTALHMAAVAGNPALVGKLIEAGADVNYGDNTNWTPLHYACMCTGRQAATQARIKSVVLLLIKAGAAADAEARSGRTPLYFAMDRGQQPIYPILLRAGSPLLVAGFSVSRLPRYLRRVIAAGDFRTYERNHLNAITATFVPKFPRLPPELVRRVVEYAFHAGDY